jgi:HK97 family phage major capsid protein
MMTKKEGTKTYPSSAYLIVGDSKKPETWLLRVRNENDDVVKSLMDASWQALHEGYNGSVYRGEGKQEAVKQLKALYKEEGVELPKSTKAESLSDKISAVHDSFREAYNKPQESSYGYVLEVFDSYVICQFGEEIYRVSYSTDGDDITFADKDKWVKVEKEYVPVKSDFLISYGTEVKAKDNGKVEGYLVLFSSESSPDLTGDFFTKETDFGNHTTTPILYHHGMDTTIGNKTIGRGNMKIDEVGVWLEAQLDMRDQYEKAIHEMAKQGKLGWSSGTAPHLVRREKRGRAQKVLSWALGLDASLTPTPAEPRTSVVAIKSLQTTKFQVEPESAQTTDTSKENKAMAIENDTQITPKPNMVTAVFDKVASEIKAQNDEKAKQLKAQQEMEENIRALVQEAMKSAPSVNQGGVEAGAPNLNLKTRRGDSEMKAFWYYMRTGDIGAVKADVILNEADNEQGLVTVPHDFYTQIVAKRDEQSIARLAGATVLQTSLKIVDIPIEGVREGAPILTAESQGATSTSYDMNAIEPFDTVAVTVYKYTRMHKVSEELLNDNKANIEPFLADRIARAFAVLENTLLLVGTGSGQPQGAVVASGAGKTAASATTIAAGEPMDLYYSLTQPYRDGAVWVMEGATEAIIRKLTGNPFLFVQTPQGTAGGTGLTTLIGSNRVFNSDAMASVAASQKSVLFANWQYYMIVENKGFQIRRLNERFADVGQIGFIASMRIGAAATQTEAFKHLVHPSA